MLHRATVGTGTIGPVGRRIITGPAKCLQAISLYIDHPSHYQSLATRPNSMLLLNSKKLAAAGPLAVNIDNSCTDLQHSCR